jgi:hypothetical protein
MGILRYPSICLGEEWGIPQKTHIRIAALWAKKQTQGLPNMKQVH